MRAVAKALYDFWSGFGLPAYPEGYASEDEQLPYITYQLLKSNWRTQTALSARLWYYGTSYDEVTTKVDQIEHAIGEGITLPCGDGFIFIAKDVNFAQFVPTEDDMLKSVYLQMIFEVNAS